MPPSITDLERDLWKSADHLRANSSLSPAQYSKPVLGLIFLKYADAKFVRMEEELSKKATVRRKIGRADYQAHGVLYLPERARYSYLLHLPEGTNIGRAINEAMKAIEEENESLRGVLPKMYIGIENKLLLDLLKTFSGIPADFDGDLFGRIYEYFLGNLARAEGVHGGKYYTPAPIVRLIAEIIEPFHGRIYDPACGSGGMFVSSARFVRNHQKDPSAEIGIYGQDISDDSTKICKMNLAVHGLEGDIRKANSYYEDPHKSIGRFDFVMANPEFNVNGIDKERLANDKRFPFGLPRNDNGNYIWIQIFLSALNETGRAGFVMANSASDAGHSELEIRKKVISERTVDVMIAVSSNFFYTVTLPVTLWFLDRRKKGTDRDGRVLFIDARNIYRQIDRAHREFTPEQIEFIANIVRLYRGEQPENREGSETMMREHFAGGKYRDVPGLCKVAALEEIEQQDWSLNPGRYVGVSEKAPTNDGEFKEKLQSLNHEFLKLTTAAHALEEKIQENVRELLALP